jgi:hypothetical protein
MIVKLLLRILDKMKRNIKQVLKNNKMLNIYVFIDLMS